ncbi:MAG: DUF2161 family putative PD-(D/E)XK-type phosphodiesterase [Candidatus Ornithomonoglobus sp.]
MRESELFEPVRKLFDGMGYKVNAEVMDCDVTASRDDELIIIELKRNLSVALLAQGLERQKTGAKVYVAVPRPKRYSPKTFRDTLYVIKKLEIGLIFVTLRGEHSFAEIIQAPEEFKPVRTRKKQRNSIEKEIDGRSLDKNKGGVTGTKITTAFREKNIRVGCLLEKYGQMSPKQFKEFTGEDCGGLLYRNYYGWFKRIEKGVYALTEKGISEMRDYPELYAYYSEKANEENC